ncbi:MAG: gamma-glutamyl-gamma-aminobutyrate hydrolase family protein [Clostridiales bacterium]|nr:gamma-glutamyl-gamma-aminobutyrate hydrolase family protein [Clostridiales bacterium]
MKPLIALTPYFRTEQNEPYMRPACLEAVRRGGGIPVILSTGPAPGELTQLAAAFDGFLFPGGPDVHPFCFGEEAHPCCGAVSPQRDALELSLLKLAMAAGKPILGICRGIQLLNIGLGGTIYQDIAREYRPEASGEAALLAHSQPFAPDLCSHYVTVAPGSLLARLSQCKKLPPTASSSCDGKLQKLPVNSMHHQAVKKPGRGLVVTGRSSDGLIEALELPDYPVFFLGVQWHPEYLLKQDQTSVRIFEAFVEAARRT